MKTQIIVMLMVILFFGNAYSLTFNDGYIHDVNSIIDEIVYIQNDPFWGYQTTVNLIEGGDIHSVYPMDDSLLNINGGISGLLIGWGNSTTLIRYGVVNGGIVMRGASLCTIENGIFNSINIQMIEDSQLKIYNGLFNFDGNNNLSISGHSSVTIYGNDFKINNRKVQSGVYTSGSGILTGTFIGGENFSISFSIDSPLAELVLAPQIEPYCIEYPIMDFNRDCKVDLIDFTEFASQWMVCNLEPQSYCL